VNQVKVLFLSAVEKRNSKIPTPICSIVQLKSILLVLGRWLFHSNWIYYLQKKIITYRFEIGFPIERVQTQVLHEREVVSQYRRWFQKPSSRNSPSNPQQSLYI